MATMSRTLVFVLATAVAGLPSGRTLAAASGGEARTFDVLSPVFDVDKRYKSMTGPQATATGPLFDPAKTELIWLTGFGSTVVTEDGRPLPQEFMCHTNLRYAGRDQGLQKTVHENRRLFTISQGQYEVRFEEGFGIPILSSDVFAIDNQILNLNVEPKDGPLRMRHRNVVSFVPDRALTAAMVPLYQVEAGVMASLEGEEAYLDTLDPSEVQHGASCAPGVPAGDARVRFQDTKGQRFTYHWVVKPGREVRRTLVTSMLGLEYDTKIHYIAVHLHPYAESLALRDLTTGQTLFTSKARNFEGKMGLENVEFLSSRDGIPIYQGRDYELVSTYDNTSGEDQDAMALIYVYLEDKRFARPGAP